jgi:hypothetical protein
MAFHWRMCGSVDTPQETRRRCLGTAARWLGFLDFARVVVLFSSVAVSATCLPARRDHARAAGSGAPGGSGRVSP